MYRRTSPRSLSAPLAMKSLRRQSVRLGLFAGVSALLLASAPAWAAPDAKPTTPVQPKAAEAPAAKPEMPKAGASKAEAKKDAPANQEKAKALTDEPELAPAQTAGPSESAGSGWLEDDATSAHPKPTTQHAPATEPAAASEGNGPPVPAENAAAAEPAAKAEPEAKKDKAEPRIRYVIPPSTEPSTDVTPVDFNRVPFTYHQLHWELSAGARVSFLRGGAFDYFSDDDTLAQMSLGAGRAFYNADRLSVAVGGLFEMGGSSATTRGMSADYTSKRFALSLEARYHLRHWLYGYARVAPAAVRATAALEPGYGASYETSTWGAGVDGALGVAIKLFGNRDGRERGARFFAFGEVGYGYVQTQGLSLAASEEQVDRAQTLELGELDPSGAFMRFGVMLTF
jgi:hypothetical protein